jgi:hypothetical protein
MQYSRQKTPRVPAIHGNLAVITFVVLTTDCDMSDRISLRG